MSIIIPSLISLVFVSIGGALITYAIKMSAKARESLSWPSTEGEVAHSAVTYQTDSSQTTGGTAYKADVSYRYKVNGVDYSSSRIALLDLVSTTGRAQNIVERYPDNSRVDVYYNPSNAPRRCWNLVVQPGSIFYTSSAAYLPLEAFSS
jgi:hypothetical protein